MAYSLRYKTVLSMIAVARRAYREGVCAPVFTNMTKYTETHTGTGRKVEFYTMLDHDGYAYISFQGSSDNNDWKDNFKFWYSKADMVSGSAITPNSKSRVHYGFYQQFLTAKSRIDTLLTGPLQEYVTSGKLVVTGHSLGSAVATLVGRYIRKAYNIQPYVYGYGSPKTGNDAYVSDYRSSIINIEEYKYGYDIVANVPFSYLGYHHIRLIKLPKKKSAWWERVPGMGTWEDHDPEDYYRAIKKKEGL